MENFKGTKGKWKLATNDYGYYTSVRNLDDTRKIVVSRVNNQTESNANMLIISKAPEMLEALKTTLNELRDINVLNNHCDYLEQLIKEATEL